MRDCATGSPCAGSPCVIAMRDCAAGSPCAGSPCVGGRGATCGWSAGWRGAHLHLLPSHSARGQLDLKALQKTNSISCRLAEDFDDQVHPGGVELVVAAIFRILGVVIEELAVGERGRVGLEALQDGWLVELEGVAILGEVLQLQQRRHDLRMGRAVVRRAWRAPTGGMGTG